MSSTEGTMNVPPAERLIFLDSETTGMSVKEGHRIIELAAKEVVGLQPTGRVFHSHFNPGREVDEGAERVHGLSWDKLKDKPLFEDMAAEFCEFVDGATLVIHNAQFDLAFIEHELSMSAQVPTWRKAVDTLKIARLRFPGAPNNLDALADRFGIDRTARTLHGALLDVEILFGVYIPLMGLNQLIPLDIELETTREAAPADLFLETSRQRWFPNRPVVDASSEELARHAAFIASIAKAGEKAGVAPLWSAFGQFEA